MISKTHAHDFPAISAARTLPLREYRSPSGIEWSPVAMEIEIYGRTDGARLAAHGIQGCRYLPAEMYSSEFEPRVRSFYTLYCLHVYMRVFQCVCRIAYVYSRRNRAKMTFFIAYYIRDTETA